jgi:hypothetical protein
MVFNQEWESRSRTNVIDGDNRSWPQGRVVVQVDEDECHKCSTSEGLHTYNVYTSFGLRSSEATEGLGLEIQQRDSVRHVEFSLTHGHDSKCGSQAKEERIGEMDEWAKGEGARGAFI